MPGPECGGCGLVCMCAPSVCICVDQCTASTCMHKKYVKALCTNPKKHWSGTHAHACTDACGHAANLAPAPPGTSEHPHECCRPDRPQLWLQRGVVAVACIHVFSLIGRTDPTTNAECGMPHMATHASRSSEAQPIMACNNVSSHLQAWAL